MIENEESVAALNGVQLKKLTSDGRWLRWKNWKGHSELAPELGFTSQSRGLCGLTSMQMPITCIF